MNQREAIEKGVEDLNSVNISMAATVTVHVIFFPLLAHGHMLPMLDVARLFASRGVKCTMISTPGNASAMSKSDNVELEIIQFPWKEVGLPEGIETANQITGMESLYKFTKAMRLISEGPLEKLISDLRPSCLVADMFLPWSADVADRAGIPWVGFNVCGYFSTSLSDLLRRKRPQWEVESEDDEFVFPGLPDQVKMSRRSLAWVWSVKDKNEDEAVFAKAIESAFSVLERSFGVIMNTFYELEPQYAHFYQNLIGKRCWTVAPLSLLCRNIEDKATRGEHNKNKEGDECLTWLDSKPEKSVIYICFGSLVNVSSAQLREVAMGVEASEQHFIWVVRKPNVEEEEWLPKGFEGKNKEKGMILRGWAPQVLILGHKAIGGFVTQCGWNSVLEGVSAGLPMVTWPMCYEQFMHEKLLVEILRVGVSVGAKQNYDRMVPETTVGRGEIEAALRRLMDGEEAAEMRRRAGELKEMAWKSVQQGGSSYNDVNHLLNQLTSLRTNT